MFMMAWPLLAYLMGLHVYGYESGCIFKLLHDSKHILHIYEPGYGLFDILQNRMATTTLANIELPVEYSSGDFDVALVSVANLSKFINKENTVWQMIKMSLNVAFLFVEYGGLDLYIEISWKLRLHKVAVISKSNLYTYTLVSGFYCFSKYLPTYLGTCDQFGDFRKLQNTHKIGNCTLWVLGVVNVPYIDEGSFAENKGIDVAVLSIVLKKLNIFPELRFVNGTNFRVHLPYIEVLGWQITSNCFNMIDCFDYERWDTKGCFISTSWTKEPWLNILLIYDYKTWIGLLISLLLVTVAWSFVNSENITTSFMYMFAALLASVSKSPKKYRLLFLSWTLAALLITNAFSGLLTATMFKALPKPSITTLEQLIANNIKIALPKVTINSLCNQNQIPNGREYLCRNHLVCEDLLEGCVHMLNKENVAVFSTKRKVLYRKFFSHSVVSPKSYLMVMHTNFRSPLTPLLNRYTKRLSASGIVNYLDTYKSKEIDIAKPTQIGLRHFYLIIASYTVGMVLSCSVFLLELIRK